LSGSTKISRIDNAYIFRYRTAATSRSVIDEPHS
jgi:hypothetical protein